MSFRLSLTFWIGKVDGLGPLAVWAEPELALSWPGGTELSKRLRYEYCTGASTLQRRWVAAVRRSGARAD